MEDPWGDPWGDPWATEAPVHISLPTAPREAYLAVDRVGSPRRKASDEASALSPWIHGNGGDDDDAWGVGWNNASPGWGGGRSPGLRSLSVAGTFGRLPASLNPWAAAAAAAAIVTAAPVAALTSPVAAAAARDATRAVATEQTARTRTPPGLLVEKSAQDIWGGGEEESLVRPSLSLARHGATTQAARDEIQTTASRSPASTVPAEQPPRCVSPDAPPHAPSGVENRNAASRQPSKVQELVSMFDGLATRGTSAAASTDDKTAVISREAIPTLHLGPLSCVYEAEEVSDEAISTDPAQTIQDDVREGGKQAVREMTEPSAATTDDNDVFTSGNRPPQVSFDVDISVLDDIFPSSSSADVPADVEPRRACDGFSSAPERKAWYRISRPGSLRRYDQGDLDDYVRISWAGSSVQERTLDIVRRWKEEDSVGSRNVPGRRFGAGGGGFVFNWNSPIPPIEIGALLGNQWKETRSGGDSSRVDDSKGLPSEMALGWSDGSGVPPSLPLTTDAPPASFFEWRESETRNGQPSPIRRPSIAVAPAEATSFTLPDLEQKHIPRETDRNTDDSEEEEKGGGKDATAEEEEEEEDNDDDEWGEMVSASNQPAKGSFNHASSAEAVRHIPCSLIEPDRSVDDKAADTRASTTRKVSAQLRGRDTSGDSNSAWACPVEMVRETKSCVSMQGTGSLLTTQGARFPRNSLSSSLISDAWAHDVSEAAETTHRRLSATDDDAVRRILDSLPDLSYMLR